VLLVVNFDKTIEYTYPNRIPPNAAKSPTTIAGTALPASPGGLRRVTAIMERDHNSIGPMIIQS